MGQESGDDHLALVKRGKPSKPHVEKRLNAAFVRSAPPGRHTDGGGLYLLVDPSGARRWLLRITVRGKRCDFGLGSAKVLSLAEARERAIGIRKTALLGGNPKVRQREEEGRATTFAEMARRVHERKFKDNKSNGKHIAQWITTLETYAFPSIGDLSVEDVSQDDIEKVIDPIWSKKPETARRVLQRISTVFDHACGSGYRTKGNPATGLGRLMRNQGDKPKHFEALAYDDVTALMLKLEAQTVVGAMALKFTILTAARSGPVRFATWDQFDKNHSKWTVPEENMKGRQEFAVPLSTHAHNLIAEMRTRAPNGAKYIFHSPKDPQKPISENTMRQYLQGLYPGATVHGMRAAFRIWAETEVGARNEVAEVSLAHTVASKTVAAYLRTDYYEERGNLMEKWGMWVMGEWEWFGDGADIDGEVYRRLFTSADDDFEI